jgi:hypothetical protein
MMRVERHPRVDADVDEALEYTLREFGPDQVPTNISSSKGCEPSVATPPLVN